MSTSEAMTLFNGAGGGGSSPTSPHCQATPYCSHVVVADMQHQRDWLAAAAVDAILTYKLGADTRAYFKQISLRGQS